MTHPAHGDTTIFTDNNIHHVVGPATTVEGQHGLRIEFTGNTELDYSRFPDALWVNTPTGDKTAQVIGCDIDGNVIVAEPGNIDLRDTVQIRG